MSGAEGRCGPDGAPADATPVADDVFADLTDADRERLHAVVCRSEEWLMDRVLGYAQALGYTQYTSTLLEAWRLSIEGLTRSISTALETHTRVPELGPDEEFSGDPAAAWGIHEAAAHRRRGVNLAMFLGLFKYYRQAYRRLLDDPMQCPERFDDTEAVLAFLRRVFDRIELGYTSEWAGTGAETQIRELSTANLLAVNEKNRMLTLVESLPIPAFLIGPHGTLDMVNFAAAELIIGKRAISGQTHYSPGSDAVPFPSWLREIVDVAGTRGVAEQFGGGAGVVPPDAGATATGLPPSREPWEVNVDLGVGDRRIFQAYVEPMLDVSAKFSGYAVLLVDVTRERAYTLALSEAAAVFEDSTNAIVVTDPHGSILTVNPAMARLLGKTKSEAVGYDATAYLGAPDFRWPDVADPTGRFWVDRHWHGEVTLVTSSGKPVPGWLTLSSVDAPSGIVERMIGIFADVSALKESEERLELLSTHDPLTGLYNRTGLREELSQILATEHTRGSAGAVLFVDLDRFKEINDSHGHAVGDRVLQLVAERLREVVRREDVLARIGGDEFLAVAPGLGSDDAAATVAGTLLTSLRDPFDVDDLSFLISGSVGIAMYPRDGDDADELIHCADAAMYRSKALGPGRFSGYTPEMAQRASHRRWIESELRVAIASGRGISLAYQPLFDLRSGRPVAVEALLRWHHDVLGDIPPGAFIPVAEDVGLMTRLGTWVLVEALEQLRQWDAAGLEVPRMYVNMSRSQLEDPQSGQELRHALEVTQTRGGRVVLDLRENVLFGARSGGSRALSHIRDLGVTVTGQVGLGSQGFPLVSAVRAARVGMSCLLVV